MISYFTVFVIRAVTMRKFIPFRMYPVRLIINTLMITAIAVIMTVWGSEIKGILTACAVLLISLVFNGRDIFLGCKDALISLKNKKGRLTE